MVTPLLCVATIPVTAATIRLLDQLVFVNIIVLPQACLVRDSHEMVEVSGALDGWVNRIFLRLCDIFVLSGVASC